MAGRENSRWAEALLGSWPFNFFNFLSPRPVGLFQMNVSADLFRLHTTLTLTDQKLADRDYIKMENQAKKRKGGDENLREEKTSPSLVKVLPIEKRLCLRSNKGQKILH